MYACILYVCCMRRALGFLDIAFLACVICRVLVSEFCKGDVLSVIFERRLHWFGAGDRAHDLWRRSEMYSAERRPFYSEILSQMRPPRLQRLITAEQHSRGHGCKEKERERERMRDHKVWVVLKKLLEGEGKCLLKQKTLSLQKHKGPRLPGDRCACCDFFFFCLFGILQTLMHEFNSEGSTQIDKHVFWTWGSLCRASTQQPFDFDICGDWRFSLKTWTVQ